MAAKPTRERTVNGPQGDAGEEVLLRSSDPEARELLDLAIRVKELAPWGWIEETDLIGIENPDTKGIGFISVMGSVGEYEAVALYLGAQGLYDFLDFQADETASIDRLLERAQLQVAFSDREYLEKQDRDLIKQLGLKFRGARAWPMFRSYRPGYLPWFITLAEARFLIHALSQTLDVAIRVRDEAQPFHPVGPVDPNGYLMRVSRSIPTGLVWEDQVWQIERLTAEPIQGIVDTAVLNGLKRIPQSEHEVEADLFLAPARIGTPGQRPVAMYVLMIADSASGFILGLEAMSAEESLAGMHALIPNSLAKILLQNNLVPRRLMVRSEVLRKLLRSLAQSLNVELRHSDELPSIDEAAESMGEMMRGGKI